MPSIHLVLVLVFEFRWKVNDNVLLVLFGPVVVWLFFGQFVQFTLVQLGCNRFRVLPLCIL